MKRAINGKNKLMIILSVLFLIAFIGMLFGNMLGAFVYYLLH